MATFNDLETDVRTWWQKFRANVVYWWHYATAWVSGLWFAILAYWGSLDKAEQINTIGNFLPAKMVSPLLAILGLVSYFVAKGWPQPKLAAKVEAKQDRLNAEIDAQQVMQVRSAKPYTDPNGPDTIPANQK